MSAPAAQLAPVNEPDTAMPRKEFTWNQVTARAPLFDTGPQFVTTLRRQRDHAVDHDQPYRAQLFTELLGGIARPPLSHGPNPPECLARRAEGERVPFPEIIRRALRPHLEAS
jgi:hypothetical protein